MWVRGPAPTALPSPLQSLQPFWAWLLCPWGVRCGNAPGQGASRAKVLHCHRRPFLGIQFPTVSPVCWLIHNRKEAISQASAHLPNRNVRPPQCQNWKLSGVQSAPLTDGDTAHSFTGSANTHAHGPCAGSGGNSRGRGWRGLVTDRECRFSGILRVKHGCY